MATHVPRSLRGRIGRAGLHCPSVSWQAIGPEVPRAPWRRGGSRCSVATPNDHRPNDGRPPAAPTTPPGVRDVSVSAPPATQPQPTAASVPADLTLIGRADRLEGTLKVADTLRIQGTLEGTVEATTVHIDEGRQGPRGHHRGRGHHRWRLQRQAGLPAAPGDPGDRPGRGPRRDLPADAPRGRLHRRRAQDAQAARLTDADSVRGGSQPLVAGPGPALDAPRHRRERRRPGAPRPSNGQPAAAIAAAGCRAHRLTRSADAAAIRRPAPSRTYERRPPVSRRAF